MSDHSELKKLAEAATAGDWHHYRHGVIKGGPAIKFTNGSAQQQIAMTTGTDWMRADEQCANADFIAAANPAAVLALIAEVEGLRAQHGRDSAELRSLSQARDDARKERDQLKAEVEALRNLTRELRGSAECINVHHCKSEQHDLDEPCKVLARIDAAMSKGDQP